MTADGFTWDERAQATARAVVLRARLEGCTCEIQVTVIEAEDVGDACRVVVTHETGCPLMTAHGGRAWRRGRGQSN